MKRKPLICARPAALASLLREQVTSNLRFDGGRIRSDGRPFTVSFRLAGPGKATQGTDYAAVSGDLSFAAGQKSRSFTVTILADTLDEGDEALTLELSDPQGGATLGSPTTATLTILENDVAGTLQFGGVAFAGGESSGTALVTVTRSGGAAGGVTVDYATSNGTATAGADYQAASGTLTFAAGETSTSRTCPRPRRTCASRWRGPLESTRRCCSGSPRGTCT